MKRLVTILLLALLLAMPAYAAVCEETIPSDGNLCRECALGNFAADALRMYTGADIALFPLGELGISFLPGEITEKTIEDSFPNDIEIVTASMTGEELSALLEQSVSHITLSSEESIDEAASAYGGFFCVSGMVFSYDASAPAGTRLYDFGITGSVTVAAPAGYLDGVPNGTIREAVRSWCNHLGSVSPSKETRIRILGARENVIIGGLIPKGFVIVIAVVALIFGGARYRKRMRTER